MSILRVKNIQKSHGALLVLSDISFPLEQGQRAALVGPNGTGKTTLLRIIAGIEEPDAGTIEIPQNIQIGYLPQDTSLVGKETVSEYLHSTSGIQALEEEIEALSHEPGDPTSVKRSDKAKEQYGRMDGYSFEHRMSVILSGFGLGETVLNQSLTDLSSGQKAKVMLAGILLKGTDLLLLDEPTNNLDLPALIWLEDFILNSSATCIVISHDRRFLDKIAQKILEIDRDSHTLTTTGGTYSEYIERARKKLTRLKEQYRLQEEEIERLADQASKKKAAAAKGSKWIAPDKDKMLQGFKREKAGKSARTAKAIEKRIEQMEKIEKPIGHDPFEINLASKKSHGSMGIELKDAVAGYHKSFTVGPLSLEIRHGERAGILGLNGVGKSTLLKLITGKLSPLQGTVSMGSGVRIGNMMQEHETLPREDALLTFLQEKSSLDEAHAFNQLVKFGFDRIQVKRKIGTLSPGGRARLLLALFSSQSVNTLVLDEPTNHLDIEALDALEETLRSYTGTVILVSHDRHFLESAQLDSSYVLSEGKLTKIPDYKTYVAEAEKHAQKLLRLL